MKRLSLLFVLLLNVFFATAQFSGSGLGTESSPYLIYNETQLYQLRNFLGEAHTGVVFKLMKDIDLSAFFSENDPTNGWDPVGSDESPFSGVLDGNNHKISGLFINRPNSVCVGFFGYIKGAEIKDLTIESTSVKGDGYATTLVGMAIESTIENCHVYSSAQKSLFGEKCAGIAGDLQSSRMSNCSFEGHQIDSFLRSAGLVVSASNSTIEHCSVKADIIRSDYYAGGLVGKSSGTITIGDCTVSSVIYAEYHVGGIICSHLGGSNAGLCAVSNTVFEGELKGGLCGGIVALVRSSSLINFRNNRAYCPISVILYSEGGVGGILGRCDTDNGKVQITSCIHIGDINASDHDAVGGIVGLLDTFGSIEACSHFGEINGAQSVGGIIGQLGSSFEEEPIYYCSNSASENTHESSYIQSYYEPFSYSIFLVKNCSSIGDINGTEGVGGIVGRDISRKFVTTNTEEEHFSSNRHIWRNNVYIGYQNYIPREEVEKLSSEIFSSYHSGNIIGTEGIGGIAGIKSDGIISCCYSNGNISGLNLCGGIVGSGRDSKVEFFEPEWYYSRLSLEKNISINPVIYALEEDAFAGRIYGYSEAGAVTVGSLGSPNGNKALTTSKIYIGGVAANVSENLQNGSNIGKSLLKLKANYVALGWDFDNDWNILETESYPYMKYQAAPPVIQQNPLSQETELHGYSLNGGDVFLRYRGEEFTTTCSGNSWNFTTEPLQSGATVQLYAVAEGLVPSYLTSEIVAFPGAGTENDPYRIYTAEDLQQIQSGAYYKLMNDLDLSHWIEINSPSAGWNPVMGDIRGFDGSGHKITGLWAHRTDQDHVGLFIDIKDCIIKNLAIEVAEGKVIEGGVYVGALAGGCWSSHIVNCTVKGSVEGCVYVGGFCGVASGTTIERSKYEGTLSEPGTSVLAPNIGGIFGCSFSLTNISEVQAKIAVSSSNRAYKYGGPGGVGGIIGHHFSSGLLLSKSLADVQIDNQSDISSGGLVGYAETGEITYSYSKGSITGTAQYAGGIIGMSRGCSIANSYSEVNVSGSDYVGGIAGYTKSVIDKCYASGTVTGKSFGGGIVAELDGPNAAVTNSVAANPILSLTSQSSWACRVIGGFQNGCPEPDESNYALSTMQVSINGVPQRKTDDNLEGIAKSESDLQKAETYIGLGWNFADTWGVNEEESYPYLLWEYEIEPVEALSLSSTNLSLSIGESALLTADILPETATNKNLKWISSNPEIATVTDGLITAVNVGNTTITVSTLDGSNITASCEVVVLEEADTDLSQYENVLFVQPTESAPGNQVALSLQMNNLKNYVGYQCDLYLPEGITFATDEDDFIMAELSTERTTSRKTDYFNVEIQPDGALRILCSSTKKYAFEGNEGEVATVIINIPSDMSDGDFPLILRDIVMTDEIGKTTEIEYVKTTITILGFTLGDANGDGSVNVGDFAATAAYILTPASAPEGFVMKAADANEDSKINVGDLAAIASIILGTPSSAPQLGNTTEQYASANMCIKQTSEESMYQLLIGIDNVGCSFSGYQFDIQLPQGMQFVEDNDGFIEASLSEERTSVRRTDYFRSAIQEDGALRVLCASTNNAMFEGENGSVATVLFKVDGIVVQDEIVLKSAKITNRGNVIDLDDVSIAFADATTSISELESAEMHRIYTLDGQMIRAARTREECVFGLPHGLYVIDGEKVVY